MLQGSILKYNMHLTGLDYKDLLAGVGRSLSVPDLLAVYADL